MEDLPSNTEKDIMCVQRILYTSAFDTEFATFMSTPPQRLSVHPCPKGFTSDLMVRNIQPKHAGRYSMCVRSALKLTLLGRQQA